MDWLHPKTYRLSEKRRKWEDDVWKIQIKSPLTGLYYKIDRKLCVLLYNIATFVQNSTLHKLISYSIVDWK